MSATPSPRSHDLARQEAEVRTSLVGNFVETLVMMLHGGDQTAFAGQLAVAQFAFVSVDEMGTILEHMEQGEMAREEGCKQAFDLLDGGHYAISDTVVELRQIASDTLQYRLTPYQIESTARVSEGVPVPLGRHNSVDDAALTCWVGGIPNKTSVQQVEDLMAQFGFVESCSMRAKQNGGSYAFVKFSAASSAVKAQAAAPVLMGGVKLKVDKVDYSMLQARRGTKATIGASNAVWQAARG